MASKCNATANNLKYEAKNATQWMQERPAAHRSGNLTMEYQTLRKKVWGTLARRAGKMVRDLTKPKCASDGSFESMQCGSSDKRCWCVDENGRKRGPVKSRSKLNCSRSEGKTKGRDSWKNIVTFKKYHWHIALLLTTFMRAFQNCIKFVALLGTIWASPPAPRPSPPVSHTLGIQKGVSLFYTRGSTLRFKIKQSKNPTVTHDFCIYQLRVPKEFYVCFLSLHGWVLERSTSSRRVSVKTSSKLLT